MEATVRHVSGSAQTRNRLLSELPNDELATLLGSAEKVQLRPRQILHHWRLPLDYVYFIERGLVSVSARVDNDQFIEAWLVGSEGLVGSPLVLGEEPPPHRRVVQVGGEALRVPARTFLTLLPKLPVTHRLLLRSVQVVLFQAAQFGACNAAHTVKERLARWLLVARYCLNSDELPITHEILSQLLAVRRATVTECVEILQQGAVIHTERGLIKVIDPEALRGSSCSCYDLVHREYQRRTWPAC